MAMEKHSPLFAPLREETAQGLNRENGSPGWISSASLMLLPTHRLPLRAISRGSHFSESLGDRNAHLVFYS